MQDLIVSVQRLTPSTIEFDLVGVDASIANALRRVMIAEVSRPGSDHRPLLTPGPHHGHRPNLRLEQHLDHARRGPLPPTWPAAAQHRPEADEGPQKQEPAARVRHDDL